MKSLRMKMLALAGTGSVMLLVAGCTASQLTGLLTSLLPALLAAIPIA